MENIPRNELINKLDCGWKVRSKKWPKDLFVMKLSCNLGSLDIKINDLLREDWEGQPPGPVLKMAGLSLFLAFYQLKHGKAKFVRRPVWADVTKMQFDHTEEDTWFDLLAEDILANDWEVWA